MEKTLRLPQWQTSLLWIAKALGLSLLSYYSLRTFLFQAVIPREYGDTLLILHETRKWVTAGTLWREFGAYSPFAQLFMAPFTYLSDNEACRILYNLNWASLLGLIYLFYRTVESSIRGWWLFWTVVFLLNFWPLAYALRAAKIEPLETLLIFACLHFYQDDKKSLSAALLAIAALLKFIPGILILYFLIKRDWKWLRSFVLTVVFFLCVTCAFFGVAYHIEFFRLLGGGYIPWIFNQAPEAALQRLVYAPLVPRPNDYYPNPPVGVLFKPAILCLKIFVLWAAFKTLSKRKGELYSDCGLLLLTVPFLMRFYREYYIMLALPFFFSVVRDFLGGVPHVRKNGAGLLCLFTGFFLVTFLGIFEVWFNPWLPEQFDHFENYHVIPYLSFPFWGFVFFLLSWFIFYGGREGKGARPVSV